MAYVAGMDWVACMKWAWPPITHGDGNDDVGLMCRCHVEVVLWGARRGLPWHVEGPEVECASQARAPALA